MNLSSTKDSDQPFSECFFIFQFRNASKTESEEIDGIQPNPTPKEQFEANKNNYQALLQAIDLVRTVKIIENEYCILKG